MVNPMEYNEIPGVYSHRPRPLAVVRRTLRNYRWGLVVAAFVIVVLLFAGTVSLLMGSKGYSNTEQQGSDTEADRTVSSSAAELQSNNREDQHHRPRMLDESVSRLLNLTWPRRDHSWYCRRWDRSKMNKAAGPLVPASLLKSSTQTNEQVPPENKNTTAGQPSLQKDARGSSASPSPTEDTRYHAGDFLFGIHRGGNSTVKEPRIDSRDSKGIKSETVVGDDDDNDPSDPHALSWLVQDGSTFPANDTFNWNREVGAVAKITMEDMHEALSHGSSEVAKTEEQARELARLRITLKEGSASHRHQTSARRTAPRAHTMARQGYRMGHATTYLAERLRLSVEQATLESRWLADVRHTPYCEFNSDSKRDQDFITQYYSHRHDSDLDKNKEKLNEDSVATKKQPKNKRKTSPTQSGTTYLRSFKVHRKCVGKEQYRTADGSCNNLANPSWGAAFTPYRRAMPPSYRDGVSMTRLSSSGSVLPSARTVSRLVHLNNHASSHSYSHLAMTWGQLVDHDITATAQAAGHNGSSIACCSDEVLNNPSLRHPECLPITAPVPLPTTPYSEQDDKQQLPAPESCMEFARSVPAPACHFGPRQQLNQLTAFLDGSVIYGSTNEELTSLRAHHDGLLLTQVTVDGRELLPPDHSNSSCNTDQQAHWDRYCFKSGDSRVNENILLAGMHTILVRYHNTAVLQLKDLNPEWGDERLFQETRRVVVAQLQHITYHEYIPSILGPDLSYGLSLSPLAVGYAQSGYDPKMDPGIANEFAAAAYRFGHSMIQGLVQGISDDGREVSFKQLKKFFFSPFELYDVGQLGSFVRGQVSQAAAAVDSYFTKQITEHLFEPKDTNSKGSGLDLVAINIQRGRDHGVPPYTRWRMWCGFPAVNNFSDLKPYMDKDTLDRIQQVYEDVQDIDLYTGGLAELPVRDGLVGPTFACILADQFIRLKKGDRFWYETDQLPQAFTPGQLSELRHSSLAGLLCQTVEGLGAVQRWPLRVFGNGNPRLPCSSSAIPRVDLSQWEEGDI